MLNITFLSGDFMKNLATWLILLIIVAMWGYYFNLQNKLPFLARGSAIATPTPTMVLNRDLPVYPSITIAPTSSSKEEDTAQIKQSLADKYGKKISDITLDISDDNGSFAVGTVSFRLAMSDGKVLAAKAADEWVIVFAGNGNIGCAEISTYHFPKSMVPECVNSNGKIVSL